MFIRMVTPEDKTKWIALSHEYDDYVKELISDLTEWYEGNETSISFENYMNAKISQNEAFIAMCDHNKDCFGIIAISLKNNRITFFGITHKCNFMNAGELLLDYALNLLNENADISTNIIKSTAKQIQNEYDLFSRYGFSHFSDGLENGAPVKVMVRKCQI